MAAIRSPIIGPHAFPKEEREVCKHIEETLRALPGYVEAFEAALRLFDHCEEWTQMALEERGSPSVSTDCPQKYETYQKKRRLLTAWKFIAVRDGIMQVFHFWHVIKAVGYAVNPRTCKTLVSYVDRKEMHKLMGIFGGTFPNLDNIRYIAAHPAQLMIGRKKHEVRHPGGGTTMIGSAIHGRSFSGMYKGREVGYILSQETLNTITSIATRYLACFKELEQAVLACPYGTILELKERK